MQKIHPLIDIDGRGRLVADKTDNSPAALLLVRKDMAQGFVFRDIRGTEMSAQFDEQLINDLVLQRPIELRIDVVRSLGPEGDGRNPFPVAIVPQVDKHEGLALQRLLHILHPFDDHASAHLLCRHGQQPYGFKGIVAQESEELPLNLSPFLLAFFGKGVGQVRAHHFPAIAHQIVHHEERNIRENI